MANLFQNLAPEHLIEVFLIIFISAILGWLLSMYYWKRRLNSNSHEWESRFNARTKDYNELRNDYSSLDEKLKETLDKYSSVESQLKENSSMSQKLADEKTHLTSQLEAVSSSNQDFQNRLADLESIKQQHMDTLPVLAKQKEELHTAKKQVDVLTKQKNELNGVVNSLKDYRAQYEDLALQLSKSKEKIEGLEGELTTLTKELSKEQEAGPKVLELSGRLRWTQSDNSLLSHRLHRLEELVEEAAFNQLVIDGKHMMLSQQEIASPISVEEDQQETPETVGQNGDLQSYQIQIWEKEGALRWAEQEKAELTQKISELEYAQSTLETLEETQAKEEEKSPEQAEVAISTQGVDAGGQLTQLALDLEALNEKNEYLSVQLEEKDRVVEEQLALKNSLETQCQEISQVKEELASQLLERESAIVQLEEELQLVQATQQDLNSRLDELTDKNLEWKGRARWEQATVVSIHQETSDIHTRLDIGQQQLEAQKQANEALETLLKRKEEDYQKLEHQLASEELAQALIQSEEVEELSTEIEALRSSAYVAAETEWNQLAEQAQLSWRLKEWEQKALGLEKSSQLLQEQKEWEIAELKSTVETLRSTKVEKEAEMEGVIAQLRGLRESAHTAAQLQADDEAENLRISLQIRELESNLVNLQSVEREKESLDEQVEHLRASLYTTAQLQVDEEAAVVRHQLQIAQLEQELGQIKEQASTEKDQLDQEIQALSERIHESETGRTQQQEELSQLSSQLTEVQQQLAEARALSDSDQQLLGEFTSFQTTLESERSFLAHRVKELQSSTQDAAQEAVNQIGELTRLSLALKNAHEKIDQLEQGSAKKVDQIQDFSVKLEAQEQLHSQRISELEAELANANKESAEQETLKQQQVYELESQLEASRQELNEQSERHHQQIANLTERLRDAQQQLATGAEEKNQHIQELESQLSFLREGQTHQATQYAEQIQQLEGSLSTANREKEEQQQQLQERITHLEAELAAAHSQKGELEQQLIERITQLEGELTSTHSQKADIEQQLNERITQLSGELTTVRTHKETEEQQMAERIQTLESQLAEASQRSEQFNQGQAQQLQELEGRLISTEQESETKDRLITQLEAQIAQLSSSFHNSLRGEEEVLAGPASVSFALELTEEAKDEIRERIFEKREDLELNFGRIGISSALEQDPLTEIAGIDAFTEERLNLIQIYSYRQIANFTSEEIELITEALELVPGTIEQKEWKKQALARLS